MRKKKLIFCDNSLKSLLLFREDIINYYASEGYEILLIAPDDTTFLPTYPNIRYCPITMNRSGNNPFKDFRYFHALYGIYKRERPGYVFHYTIKPNIYGTLAARCCNIHSSAMIAGLGYTFNHQNISSRIARLLYRFAMHFTDYVFVLNTHNKDILIKRKIVPPQKIILLSGGEGINLKLFTPINRPCRQYF